MCRLIAATATLFFCLTGAIHGQSPNATVTGRVTDTSKAIIAGAKVGLTNQGTNIPYTGTTNQTGIFYVTELPVGTYRIQVEKPGFKDIIRPDVVLHVQEAVEINFEMAVGSVAESITVQGGAPLVELSTSSISSVVDSITVRELPLNGRDWTLLASLQPGVVALDSIQAPLAQGLGRGERGFGVQMSIAGARPIQNNYRIDGINVNDYEGGSPAGVFGASLGVDAIQEFSVLTSNYSAEYGRTSAGVVSAITKSGTNELHGNAYEFLRNSALDARNYFDPAAIPEFRRNQFGASLGGPIRKDRTFFFGDYEGLRQNLGATTTDLVPSLGARNGIFHNADGTTTTVQINPLVQPFLTFWAPPNGPLVGTGNTAKFSFSGSQVTTDNFVTARVDHKVSEKDNLFSSYQMDKGNISLPDALDDVLIGNKTDRQLVAIGENHIFSSQLLNSFRVGYNRSAADNNYTVKAINPAAADTSLAAIPAHGVGAPAINVPGIAAFLGGVNSPTQAQYNWNAFQGYDDFSFTKGIQSLKFGVSIERDQQNFIHLAKPGGQFQFGSLQQFLTDQPLLLSAGIPSTITPRNLRQSIFGGYLQDDVRWRPNLTVNLGLRYEMSTVIKEVNGKLVSLRNLTDPTPHLGDPLYLNPTLRNFEPRVGFAWDPFRNGRTSVRGSFGILDVLPLIPVLQSSQTSAAPFFLEGSATSLAPGSFPKGAFSSLASSGRLTTSYVEFKPQRNYVLQWNLNIQRELMPNMEVSVAYVGSHSVHQPFFMDDANMALPTLTPAGYLWPFPAGSGTVLNPDVANIAYRVWQSSALYDALEFQINKRMSHGFQFQGSYTWGRAIDEGGGGPQSDPYLNSIPSLPTFFDSKLRRGAADFNISQSLTINYTWNIPTAQSLHGAAAWAAAGWELGGILTVQSGLPFTPLIGGDPVGENNADPWAFPDRLRGPGCNSLGNPGNVSNYIKLQCFALPMATPAIAAECTPFEPGGPGNPVAVGTCANLYGNGGRNEVIGPGLANFDFSLFKNNYLTRISESFNAQFRVEIFNVFNHSNFVSPIDNSTVFDQTGAPVGGAGSIDSTSTTSRQIQFALKLIW